MEEFFKRMLHNKLIMAIVSVMVGIILIVGRSDAVASMIRVVGMFLLVGGAACLVTYFFGRENKNNPSTLASAILCLLVSFLFLYAPEWLVNGFPVVMGLALIVNSVFNLSALFSASVRTGSFWLGVLLSGLTLLFGLVAVMQPAAMASFLITFVGVTYLFNGICDLVAVAVVRD